METLGVICPACHVWNKLDPICIVTIYCKNCGAEISVHHAISLIKEHKLIWG